MQGREIIRKGEEEGALNPSDDLLLVVVIRCR